MCVAGMATFKMDVSEDMKGRVDFYSGIDVHKTVLVNTNNRPSMWLGRGEHVITAQVKYKSKALATSNTVVVKCK